jgi:cytosine/adenosine deaminase-related metal-dependent hydrolase
MEQIEAELLIPGGGEAVSDEAVIIDGPVISYSGPASQAPATPEAAVHRAAAVMPGMWDCHGHFLGAGPAAATRPS